VAVQFRNLRTTCTVVAAAICVSLIRAIVWLGTLPPVPERFAEASTAFLYATKAFGRVTAGFAAASIVAGTCAWWRIGQGARTPTLWQKAKVGTLLGLGALLAVAAVPLLWKDTFAYTALTDSGLIDRAYWSGEVIEEAWPALHHVEFECEGMRRGDRLPRPALALYSVRGRTSIDPLAMSPFGMSKVQGLQRFDEFRTKAKAPIVWGPAHQQKQFQDGNPTIAMCAEMFLDRFPAENRAALSSSLAESPAVRTRVLDSYYEALEANGVRVSALLRRH